MTGPWIQQLSRSAQKLGGQELQRFVAELEPDGGREQKQDAGGAADAPAVRVIAEQHASGAAGQRQRERADAHGNDSQRREQQAIAGGVAAAGDEGPLDSGRDAVDDVIASGGRADEPGLRRVAEAEADLDAPLDRRSGVAAAAAARGGAAAVRARRRARAVGRRRGAASAGAAVAGGAGASPGAPAPSSASSMRAIRPAANIVGP